MRTVLLSLLLPVLSAPLAAPAHAQTEAAQDDAALVEAVLDAVQIETVTESMMGGFAGAMPPGLDDALDFEAVEDTLRARLLADGRTADLRAVLAFLEGPANAALVERGLQLMEEVGGPDGALEMVERARTQDEATLADEALVRRFVRAQGLRERMPIVMRRMLSAMAEAVPETGASMEAAGGVDAMMGPFTDSLLDEMEETQVAVARAAYADFPEAVLAEAVEFYESPAGRYFTDVSFEATMDAVLPGLVAALAPTLTGSARGGAGVAPPSSAPTDGPEIFEVAEVQPELVGGLAALQEAVVYPESARRDGTQGTVVVQFVVDEAGAVTDPVAVRSPDDRLSEAALAAVRQQRFTPGRDGGEAVPVRFAVPVTFRLRGPEPAEEDAPSSPAADESGVYDQAEVMPELIGGLRELQMNVVYPEEARRRGVQGTVFVQFVVDEDGLPTELAVTESPHPLLAKAGLDAVREVRFTPGLVGGEPVKVRFAVPVNFRLR